MPTKEKEQLGSCLQAKEGGLRGNQPCWHLGLRLEILELEKMNFCYLNQPGCGGALLRQQWQANALGHIVSQCGDQDVGPGHLVPGPTPLTVWRRCCKLFTMIMLSPGREIGGGCWERRSKIFTVYLIYFYNVDI